MMNADVQYLSHLESLLTRGRLKGDRTGTGTLSIFGHQMRFDISEEFPLLTTKRVHFKSILHELLWFINGDTNIRYLKDNGVKIWDEWAHPETGELGPVYGRMWRSWPNIKGRPFDKPDSHVGLTYQEDIDQLQIAIDQLRNTPNSRRILVSSWNPTLLPDETLPHYVNIEQGKQVLPPCHTMFQFMSEPMTLLERIKVYLADYVVMMDSTPGKVNRRLYNLRTLNDCILPSGVRVDIRLHDVKRPAVCPELSLSYILGGTELTENQLDHVSKYLDRNNIPSRYLSLQMYQRSADWFLGVPFNIASYALLCCMVAKITNHAPKDFIHSFGDTHLYMNHVNQAKEQLSRPNSFASPLLSISGKQNEIDDFQPQHFEILDYFSHGKIKAPIAV